MSDSLTITIELLTDTIYQISVLPNKCLYSFNQWTMAIHRVLLQFTMNVLCVYGVDRHRYRNAYRQNLNE